MSQNHVKTMKQGATGPQLRVQIVNESNGQAQDLTDAEVQMIMCQVNDDSTTSTLVDSVALIDSPETEGKIRYIWNDGDTDVLGNHQAFFKITYATGVEEIYPKDGYIEIRIESGACTV